QTHQEPAAGLLIDTTNDQCGYDFKICADRSPVAYIEVKGMISGMGGITFTDKEWRMATELGGMYYLVIVSSINSNPIITCIRDPARRLTANRRLQTVIQTVWQVSAAQLRT